MLLDYLSSNGRLYDHCDILFTVQLSKLYPIDRHLVYFLMRKKQCYYYSTWWDPFHAVFYSNIHHIMVLRSVTVIVSTVATLIAVRLTDNFTILKLIGAKSPCRWKKRCLSIKVFSHGSVLPWLRWTSQLNPWDYPWQACIVAGLGTAEQINAAERREIRSAWVARKIVWSRVFVSKNQKAYHMKGLPAGLLLNKSHGTRYSENFKCSSGSGCQEIPFSSLPSPHIPLGITHNGRFTVAAISRASSAGAGTA